MSLVFAALFVVSAAAVLAVPVMAEGNGDSDGPAYNATNVNWPETVEGVVGHPVHSEYELPGREQYGISIQSFPDIGLTIEYNPSGELMGRTVVISGTPTAPFDGDFQVGGTAYTITGHITIRDVYTVTFDAGQGQCATSSLDTAESVRIVLPDASLNGYDFRGRYTAEDGKGERIGGEGDTYTPTGDIKLFAYFVKILYDFEDLADARYQVESGGFLDHTPSFTMGDGGSTDGVTYVLRSNPLGDVVDFDPSTGHLSGYLRNVLPSTDGGYVFEIELSKDGYNTATQKVTVNVPVFVYEPLTATVETDSRYSYNIEANPSDAYISEVVVYRNDAVTTTGFTETHDGDSGKRFTITFGSEGVWEVTLLISADGCASTTKQFTFNVTAPVVYDEDPSIDGIQIAQHPTANGGYYFTAVNPQNYNQIIWTISDGTTEENSTTIFHRFDSQNSYVITCTLKNSSTGKTASHTEHLIPLMDVEKGNAYINEEYAYLFTNVPGKGLKLVTSPDQSSWLKLTFVDGDDGAVHARLSGTCTNGALADTEVRVTIMDGDEVYDSWTLTICADPDTQDADIQTSVDGYVVTITNKGTSGNGSVMYIDWNGDGSYDETVRGRNVATHDYNRDFGAGTYSIKVEYNYYGNQRLIPLPAITVPSAGGDASGFNLYFDANGGSGDTMPARTGTTVTVPECTYTNGGLRFLGWNTLGNGLGDVYMPGDTITLTGTTTLYAMWGQDGSGDEDDNDIVLYVAIAMLAIVVAALVVRTVV